MYSIESAGNMLTRRPLPLLSDARELHKTGGVILDTVADIGQRPLFVVNVVISIASGASLKHWYNHQ